MHFSKKRHLPNYQSSRHVLFLHHLDTLLFSHIF
nr:MAG TPA: hypothetical protein [Caudoviricetes sp.]DAT17482.1 MAG TPA: hypothetical protein [Caudoviricetes sp.]DAU00927.1 MAG TPA: hypothetical protein [Caudoviricetes sp.]DAX38662.1 MAG TPA: hypothetical protein [Caudoviricetes sp.]